MAKKVKLDFSGVDTEIRKGGGGGKHIPEGDYKVKILDAEYVKPEDGKAGGYRWTCQVVEGTHKGVRLRGFTSFKPEALWSLRNLINAALGKNVAGKSGVLIDPEKLYGKVVGAAVEDNVYKKGDKERITSQINTFFPKDEIAEGDDDDEEEDDEDEETEEDDEDEDLEDVEVEEL